MTNYSIGVDGCRSGWFATWIAHDGTIHTEVQPSVAALLEAHPSAHRILIDIPIGLVSTGERGRRCDGEARRLLGQRASSVFSPPCREAVRASDYLTGCSINELRTGKRLSRQAWGIVSKIREVDDLLTGAPELRSCVIEVHPEVLFWALSGSPMRHGKKTKEGVRERLDILERFLPGAVAAFEDATSRWRRSEVAKDDVLDALAAALTSRLMDGGSPRAVPEVPERDELGLPMQMVYWEPSHLTSRS